MIVPLLITLVNGPWRPHSKISQYKDNNTTKPTFTAFTADDNEDNEREFEVKILVVVLAECRQTFY